LQKRKCTINPRVQKILDMEQLHHFGTVFGKEDREKGKVVQKPCLFTRQSRSVCNLTVAAASATLSRDKIAGVASV